MGWVCPIEKGFTHFWFIGIVYEHGEAVALVFAEFGPVIGADGASHRGTGVRFSAQLAFYMLRR